jgi:diguanylate cyclase (GGDEF)-like protein
MLNLNPAVCKVLEDSSLFHNVGLEAIEYRLETCDPRTLAPGQVLIDPKEANDHLYIVLSGQLRVYLGGRDLPAHAILAPGDCAGELSLIDGQPPSALVIAAEKTEVLAISHNALWSMVDSCHGVARNLLTLLAGRLRQNDLALVATQSQSLEFDRAATVDSLTGLHNRRWLTDAFPRAMERCIRDGVPLCVVMVDIDRFKDFNDRHGHLVGDTVLSGVASRVAAGLRTQDLIARSGGEQFAVLLPGTNTLDGLEIAQRIRVSVEQIHFARSGHTLAENVTVSCGVAPLRLGDTLDTLIASADKALARAKAGGRNRVDVAPEG